MAEAFLRILNVSFAFRGLKLPAAVRHLLGAEPYRTYTVTYTASDGSGNDADGSATVVAPHNNN